MSLANALQLVTLVMTFVMILKHLLAPSLATSCLPVDFILVEKLAYVVCTICTVVTGQALKAVMYEAVFESPLEKSCPVVLQGRRLEI